MNAPINQTGVDFSISKLYMWRCVVAMAHADGIIHQDEKDYLLTMFGNMRARAGMPDEYYAILTEDLQSPQDVANLLPYINEPVYRGQVVYFARLLAYIDGELHPAEEKLLNKLHASVMKGVDLDAIRKEVAENVKQEIILHDAAIDGAAPQKKSGNLLAYLIDELACRFGIDSLRQQ